MVSLLLAIASSALIAIIMRISTNKVKAGKTMLAANYLVCFLMAALYAGFDRLFPAVSGFPAALGLGVINGALYLGGFVMMQRNVKRNGVVLSSIFMKLGLLVPMALSILLFGEMPSWLQIAGFVLALIAIVLINLRKGSQNATAAGALLLMLLMNGTADAMSKIFEEVGDTALSDPFLFYTFLVAFLLCLVLVILAKEKPDRKSILFGILIGIPNFFSAKFLLMALQQIPAVIVYPTFNVAGLMVVTLAGVAFFKERLKAHQWVALGIIAAALVMLNV